MSNSFTLSYIPEFAALSAKIDINRNVRGTLLSKFVFHTSSDFVEIINVSGPGVLYKLLIKLLDAGDTMELMIVRDSINFDCFVFTGSAVMQVVFPLASSSAVNHITLTSLDITGAGPNLFNMDFQNTLVISTRRSAGTAAEVQCYALYSLDKI
ncbi:hypothetical protein ES705_12813 [subsurface metagenome]